MAAGIFVERDGELVSMTDLPYSSEDLLQALLERHSELLAGDQLTPDLVPRRFILVRGEAGVPDTAGAADRWSLDHLFLDQDGVPGGRAFLPGRVGRCPGSILISPRTS